MVNKSGFYMPFPVTRWIFILYPSKEIFFSSPQAQKRNLVLSFYVKREATSGKQVFRIGFGKYGQVLY
jgi:hypothetical protein